jgi:outer membrane protein OmpA-like peptidoglycan-associated protein
MNVKNSRIWALAAILFLAATVTFADGPAKKDDKSKDATTKTATTSDTATTSTSATSTPSTSESSSTPAATVAATTAAAPAAALAPTGFGVGGIWVGPTQDDTPAMIPMAAYGGGLGLFTVQTGDTLPRGAWAFSGGVNKSSDAPGSVTILDVGWSVSTGLTDRITLYAQWDPEEHAHVGIPSQLSFNSPFTNPVFAGSIYRSVFPLAGARPAYVESNPFISGNGGGVGAITLGQQFGLLSELRGNKVSVNVTNEIFVPTRTSLSNLINNEVQTGALADQINLNISKHFFGKNLQATSSFGYRFTQDPTFSVASYSGTPGVLFPVKAGLADQVNLGAGFVLFPEKRIQFMTEYTSTIYTGASTPNTTFGARDPVYGVWGLRLYATKWLAFDAGYRYALNLAQVNDRNGFVLKVGAVYWPEKPKAPDNVGAACSLDKSTVVEGSGDTVTATVNGTDTYNHPLNYMWTATGGTISGTGSTTRWDSASAAPGSYTITAHVDDGHGNTASCSSDVSVTAKPIPAPTMSCSANPSSVLVGERAKVTAMVNDQSGTPLNYTWQANAGQVVGSGESVDLDTTGLAAGTYTVTGRVENGKGGAADCSANVTVNAPMAPPQPVVVGQCVFKANSARVDNVCQRLLDTLALDLQNDPQAKGVVVGIADPKEKKSDKLAQDRADNAKKYLSAKKGVADSRIETRTKAGQDGGGDANRAVIVVNVPAGASY